MHFLVDKRLKSIRDTAKSSLLIYVLFVLSSVVLHIASLPDLQEVLYSVECLVSHSHLTGKVEQHVGLVLSLVDLLYLEFDTHVSLVSLMMDQITCYNISYLTGILAEQLPKVNPKNFLNEGLIIDFELVLVQERKERR